MPSNNVAKMSPTQITLRNTLVSQGHDLVESISGQVSELGFVLKQLREGKLYRDTHETWAKFVADEFTISKREADKKIESAEATKFIEAIASPTNGGKGCLGPTGPISNPKPQAPPKLQAAARELGKVPEESFLEVYEAAQALSANGQPTAKDIRQSVKEVYHGEEPEPDEQEPEPLAWQNLNVRHAQILNWLKLCSGVINEMKEEEHFTHVHQRAVQQMKELRATVRQHQPTSQTKAGVIVCRIDERK